MGERHVRLSPDRLEWCRVGPGQQLDPRSLEPSVQLRRSVAGGSGGFDHLAQQFLGPRVVPEGQACLSEALGHDHSPRSPASARRPSKPRRMYSALSRKTIRLTIRLKAILGAPSSRVRSSV